MAVFADTKCEKWTVCRSLTPKFKLRVSVSVFKIHPALLLYITSRLQDIKRLSLSLKWIIPAYWMINLASF